MNSQQSKPLLSFLWRPQEIKQAVVDTAFQTGTGAIFDTGTELSGDTVSALGSAGATDIQVSVETAMDSNLASLLQESGVATLWIEYNPALTTHTPETFLKRLQELSGRFTCIPISGNIEFLTLAFTSDQAPAAIAIKGNEAAGFVSNETAGILFALLKEATGHQGRRPDLVIWGGVATPEAAAAFLCSGAKGIVFESLHWQTDLVSLQPDLKQRLSKLRPEHMTVVGRSLGISCRFFDKGNSSSVRELKQYADSLFNCEDDQQTRHAFARHIDQTAIPALESHLDRRELVFLGPEAAFAEEFAQQFGRSTRQAFAAFSREVLRVCGNARQMLDRLAGGGAADSLGTRYPFIQGAMSWISDLPEFAAAVAEGGGLPVLALGMKSRADLERDLGKLSETMGKRAYAVNFLALPENPHLEEQLSWIEEVHPPFAVIAAGEPSYAARLQKNGIQTFYIASSEGLIRMALETGVRFIVLEGNEAGGHIGEHSTLTLTQICLALKRKNPALFQGRHVVVAGGIYNRETAFRAFMLGADAVQMGTAYLATREVVATGALRPLYQRLVVDSQPGMTAISGESIGLRVRSLKTRVMDAICTLENEWASGRHDEISFRQHLEALGANSLLIAARGVRQPHGPAIDEETCAREGQFMSGAIAGAVKRIRTIADFHHDLAEGPLELTIPEMRTSAYRGHIHEAVSREKNERVAITGVAVVNALGNSPAEVWDACLAMKSGLSEVPLSKWDHAQYFDPDPRAQGKTYCNVGAFQNIEISRKELAIPPQDFRTMADSTRLTLWLAEKAIKQSGILDSDIPRGRIAVLISQNSGEAAGTITDLVFDVYSQDVIHRLQQVVPMTPELAAQAERKIREGRLRVDDTTLLGRLNCAAGGFVCNKYGFQGPSFSVSAACATGLVALYSALMMMKNGIIDAAIVGGGEEPLKPSHFLEFSALKALAWLSGPRNPVQESSRPFDATRDGMVLGEGGGMIVIERESVAKKRGAPIQAYVTGVGASNNDQGMVEPVAETQMPAIEASFRDAGYGADQVDMVECHGTSTVHGDIEEVKALTALFVPSSRTVLTSFKSQIGHTLGASGLCSLIRGISAMQAGVFPATLNYHEPDPQIDLKTAGFRIPARPEEWPRHPDHPRRLQVDAFGFGGANYVVQIEESRGAAGWITTGAPLADNTKTPLPPTRDFQQASFQGVSFFTTQLGGEPYRLGVTAPDVSAARAKVASAITAAAEDRLSEKTLRVMARKGIFAEPVNRPVKPLAYVFAGQGSQYIGMGKELYETFPEIRKWMDRIATVADFDILDLLFNSTEENLQKTRWQQPALYTMEFAMVQNLISMGAVPTAMAGHSLGELVALAVAGVFSWEDGFRIVNRRAQCMDKAGEMKGDPSTMIATNAPMAYLKEQIASREGIYFTNYNAPTQAVLGGSTEALLGFMEKIKTDGHKATRLKVSMAFHSPIMKVIHDEMAAFVSSISFHAPKIPVISNTTMKPYPDDPDRIRAIIMAHLETPVHWMQNVRTLWDDFGIRSFVEIGPKDTLCNLVGDTLQQALCVPICMPEEEAGTYRSGVARLYALGHLKVDGIPLTEPAARPAVPGRPAAVAITTPTPSADRVGTIVQREINTFLLESFGKIIKPQIVAAVRREVDPAFTGENLDRILQLPSAPIPSAAPPEKAEHRIVPVVRKTAAASPQPAAASVGVPARVDYLEQVIQIIMDATGYERDEIEPDMDLRSDLAIRSSRLPVIMANVEQTFAITVNVEDFIDKRTVREVADCIAELAGQSAGASALVQAPETAPAGPAAVSIPETGSTEAVDYLEQVIRIIMDATGYERDEIEPDMDLRSDLAIRSSRLPVIMANVEQTFGITVNVEDFVDKRTVREIADCIEGLAGGSGKGTAPAQPAGPTVATGASADADLQADDRPESLKRLILEETALPPAVAKPLAIKPGQYVGILRMHPESGLAEDLSRLVTDRFGVHTLIIDCLEKNNTGGFDITTDEGALNAAQKLSDSDALAGLILAIDGTLPNSRLSGPEDIPAFLTGYFQSFKSLVRSKSKAFCLSLQKGVRPHTPEALAAEGVMGMFLAAALEYPSLLFRSLAIDIDTDIELTKVLDTALDAGNPLIQLTCRKDQIFSTRTVNEPLTLAGEPGIKLAAGDVVVISGGAKGVTYRIVRALAPFKVRVVLLGRTELDPAAAYGTLQSLQGPEHGRDKSADETAKGKAGLDIASNISRLSTLGLKVTYHQCDVADAAMTAQVLEQVIKQFGRIDGIIHGAGLIRDAFTEYMTPEDFQQVMAVKFTGALNLYRTAKDHGLRFFAALSSIVAVQGNVGQANYCAANRTLSALLQSLSASHKGLVAKAMLLPPIEGTGMADNPEVKELMKLKGLASAFVHADELAQMFCRELFLGSPEQCRVLLARTFPAVRGTLIEATQPAGDAAGGLCFKRGDLPMIGTVEDLNLKEGELTARRTYTLASDPWLKDHKPFRILKHPLVSGIMAIETFLEAGHLLYPHLRVLGLRRLKFADILEIPAGTEREARIVCRRQKNAGREIRCDVNLSSADMSPSGRILDRWSTNYEGQVILASESTAIAPLPELEINASDLDTRLLTPSEIQDSYERRTGLTGRYRVLETIQGTGPGVVKGDIVYREQEDVAGLPQTRYQYAPYLMEAMMHLFAFYPALREEEVSWDLIPAGMEELRFTRLARHGEHCTLDARLRSQDEQGFTWDARAVDKNGITILQVRSMRMNRFSQ